MKLLIFSDLHQFNPDDLSKIDGNFDYIIFLGDIKASSIVSILDYFPDKKSYGILGNHDDDTLFKTVNSINGIKHELLYGYNNDVTNLHLVTKHIKNITCFGIEGSVKYKENMIGYTQEDAMLFDIPKTDILFTHDSGYLYFPQKKNDPCHEGFKAITHYIKEKQPAYHIFGHQHENIDFMIENTLCICIYGCSLINMENNDIKHYF